MATMTNRALLTVAAAMAAVLIALGFTAAPALAQGSIDLTQDTYQVSTSDNGDVSQNSSQRLGNLEAGEEGSISASQVNTQDAATNGDIEQDTEQETGNITTRGEAGITQDNFQVGTSDSGDISQSAGQRLGDLEARDEGRLSAVRRNTQDAQTNGDTEQSNEQQTGDITVE